MNTMRLEIYLRNKNHVKITCESFSPLGGRGTVGVLLKQKQVSWWCLLRVKHFDKEARLTSQSALPAASQPPHTTQAE